MTGVKNSIHSDQLRKQTVLAKFGELALKSDDLDKILTEACRLVGDAFGTELAKVMKLSEDGETLLVRAGVGWRPGIVGILTLKLADNTSEGLALKTGEPTISPNIATEKRFRYPQFLIDNGVKAMANVAILGGEGRSPFGILQIDSRVPRRFTGNDIAFLRSYANLVAAAVDRLRVISEARAAKNEADRANLAKSRFLANMSHELRTPLNGVLGYTQLLRLDGGLSSLQASRVDAMMSAGNHLLLMINRILELSEIEAEGFELNVTEFDLSALAAMCLDSVRPMAEAKMLRLDLALAPDIPRFVTLDATHLRQLLLNLLGNAVKFTKEGSVELRLRPCTVGLRAEVADTGPGLSPEQHHRLFQEFERLNTDASNPPEGAGLGLAISARIAARMGGHLGHDDNQGGGSVFWLELPLTATVNPTPIPTKDPLVGMASAATNASERVVRVLVVDDVAMNRDIAGAFLRASGYDVAYAEGGAEAVTAVTASDFDVVLMDVRMPGVDGLEATRRIRLLNDGRRQVPIVAVTGQALSDQIESCRKAGMRGHVTKPFTPETLRDAIVLAIG